MKKIILGIIMALFVLIPTNVLAKDKVTVYMFRGGDCPHCEEAISYIKGHKEEIPENVEIITYEVWENASNSKLQDTVAEKLGIDTTAEDYGVPLFVVGNEYVKGYSDSSDFMEVMNLANGYLNSKKYQDLVKETETEMLKEDKDLKFESNELIVEPNKTVTIVVYSVFGIIIIGFIAMMVFSRK